MEDGIKEIVNDCLYPKEESLAAHMKEHLKAMAPEKMKRYEQNAKWNILWRKIEEKVNLCLSLFLHIFNNYTSNLFI